MVVVLLGLSLNQREQIASTTSKEFVCELSMGAVMSGLAEAIHIQLSNIGLYIGMFEVFW